MDKAKTIRVGLIPGSLLSKKQIYHGVLIQSTILAFFESEKDLPRGYVQLSGRIKDGEMHLQDGTRVATLIRVPDIVDKNTKLVSIENHTRDALIEALSLYTKSPPPSTNGQISENKVSNHSNNSNSIPDSRVPDVLVRFCRATSVASHAAATGDVRWKHVSMVMATRTKPISSTIGIWLDTILGIIAIVVLATYWRYLARLVDGQLAFEDRTLKDRVEFVMQRHAPLGFKLNPQADFDLGNLVILVVDAWGNLVSYPTGFGKEFVILACTTAAILNRGIGLSVLYGVAFDGFALLSTHVGVLHRVIARILRFQLGLIGSLALLMRGKKRNMLRHRVDTLKTDSAQLMLGTMAIFFFSFTLQTTLAYHILVLAVWSLVFIIQCSLFFVCVLLKTLPIDEFLVAIKDRKQLRDGGPALSPHHFYFDFDESTKMWRLVVVPVTVGDVITSWMQLVGRHWSLAWKRRWGERKVFQNVLFGHELPSVPPPDFRCSN